MTIFHASSKPSRHIAMCWYGLTLLAISCDGPSRDAVISPETSGDPMDTDVALALEVDDAPTQGTVQSWSRTTSAITTVSADGLALAGAVTYVYAFGAESICDVDIHLEGTASSHLCDGCDFAFDTTGEITRDEGREDCEMTAGVTFIETDIVRNLILAFAEHYPVWNEDYGWVDYEDVVLVGASFDRSGSGGGYYPGPYWYPMYWESPYWDEGWSFREGDALGWGDRDQGEFYGLNYYEYCWTAEWSDATASYPGVAATDSVACSTDTMDGFTLEARAGDVLSVSVDTVDVDSDFDPTFFVNGPDDCAVVRADDNFICTPALEGTWGEDSLALCPSARFLAPTTGTYTLWILSTGAYCNLGSTVDYTLSVARNP